MAEMDTLKKKLTADDLFDMPDDGKRYELIEGELIEMAPAGGEHGSIAAKAISRLDLYGERTERGRSQTSETGFITRKDNNTVRAPDASFISFARIPEGKMPKGFVETPPELVFEVISPSERAGDIDTKTKEWLDFGVLMVCNVYPSSKSIHVYQPNKRPIILLEDDVLDGGDVLPGFQVKVSDFFKI